MEEIDNSFKTLFSATPYGVEQNLKSKELLVGLNSLTKHHYKSCVPYSNIIDSIWKGPRCYEMLSEIPYLPVSLFKQHRLSSVPPEDLRMTLTSSGTTGQVVSQIMVDTETSKRQQHCLANSLTHVLGKKRLPMLVIDTKDVFKNSKMMNARGAGVLGMMRYGYKHAYALKHDLSIDINAIKTFLDEHGDAPFFMFGFTFIVWVNFFEALKSHDINLSNGILIHSGGWKKMTEKAVTPNFFRETFYEQTGLKQIFNFYGMVEQIGSIFLEGSDGLLFPPNFSDVIIRSTSNWEEAKIGEPGIVQVLSLIPRSYPGHSLLTEDIGVIEGVDCGTNPLDGKVWMGKGIRILGRVPKAELRGCSDVAAMEQAG